jgi:TPR repeat protein
LRIGGYDVVVEKLQSSDTTGKQHERRRLKIGVATTLALALVVSLAWWYPSLLIHALHLVHLRGPSVLHRRAAALDLKDLSSRAEAGDARAQFELFEALSETPDSWKGEQWLKQSAQLGYPEAEKEMGDRAEDADDHSGAVDWYRKAAVQGNGRSSTRLGSAYLWGEGVPRDSLKALWYFEAGAQKGDGFAAEILGGCYLDGHCALGEDFGFRQNFAEACEWLFVARALGSGPTCDSRIQAHLSKSQFEHARDEAARFLSAYSLTPKRADWATAP